MKKMMALLIGLAFLLSGCDGNEQKMSSVSVNDTVKPSEIEKNESPEQVKTNDEKADSAETDKPNETLVKEQAVDSALKSEKSESAVENESSEFKSDKKAEETTLAVKPLTNSVSSSSKTALIKPSRIAENKTETPKPKAVKSDVKSQNTVMAKEKSAKPNSTKKVAATTQSAEIDSGLSEEERRVGVQRPLSIDEINYLKTRCQYPFMSDKEMRIYRCLPVKVTITN